MSQFCLLPSEDDDVQEGFGGRVQLQSRCNFECGNYCCRALRGVLVSRAGRWLQEAAAVDSSGTAFHRMVDVMEQIVQVTAAL